MVLALKRHFFSTAPNRAPDPILAYKQDAAFARSLTFAIQTFGQTTLDDALGMESLVDRAEMHARILSHAPQSHSGEGNAEALSDVAELLESLKICIRMTKDDGGSTGTSLDISRGIGKMRVTVTMNADKTLRITDGTGRVLNGLPLGEIIGFSNQDHTPAAMPAASAQKSIWARLGLG